MGLRRRRKLEVELLELVRGELTTMRSELQATLAETAAVLSARVRTEVEHRMGEPSALAAGIQSVRETIGARDADLVQVLKRVVETCDSLAERVQLDRLERTALVDAVSRLTTAIAVAGTLALPATPIPGRATVIGGTVEPLTDPQRDAGELASYAAPAAGAPDVDIDLAEADPEPAPAPTAAPRSGRPVRPDGVEVRCRFGDRWVSGFEVCEVIRSDDSTRYRLRRRSDGSVIPTLFDEKDLRFFSTAFAEPT